MSAKFSYLVCALFFGGAILTAQDRLEEQLLAKGQGLHDVLEAPEGLLLQGRRLVSLIALAEKSEVLSELKLGPEVFLWTRAPGVSGLSLFTQSAGSRSELRTTGLDEAASEERREDEQSFFRGLSSSEPRHAEFVRREGDRLISVSARLDGLELVVSGAEDYRIAIAAEVESEQSLGWGLGYEMSARLVAPFFAFAAADAEDGAEILYRDNDRFMMLPLGGPDSKPVFWGRAPTNEKFKVVRFDQRVAPLVDDFDGDALDDLVHVDPGGGYVFVYRGRGRAAGEGRDPDQVFNVGGHVLWRYLEDVNGDGRKDLVCLTMSRLNLLAQVSVMRERSLPVRLLCRHQNERGDFEASAAWSLSLDLPCEIALTRNMRRVRYRAPVLILPARDGQARVLGSRDGRSILFERAGEDWSEKALFAGGVLETGHWSAPFDAIRRDFDGDGQDELILLARDLDGLVDRLIRVRLP